jgi:hypothetical protein
MSAATNTLVNKMPPWAVGVLVVAGIGVVGISGFLIYKKIKNMKAEKDSKKEVGDVDDDLKALQKSGKKLSLTGSEIASIANNLFTAMDGYGTNYDMILKNLVRVNNQVDLLAVIKSYGVRELSSGRLNPEPNFKGTLGQAFAEELSSTQLSAINLMLAKKGIAHRF